MSGPCGRGCGDVELIVYCGMKKVWRADLHLVGGAVADKRPVRTCQVWNGPYCGL